MKILYWTLQYAPEIGGVEILSQQALPALCERGYEFTVVTSHSERNLPDLMHCDDIPVHRFPMWQSLSRRDIAAVIKVQRQIAELKRAFKPDLVHLNFPGHVAYFHLNTMSAHSSPTLLTMHSDFSGYQGGPDTLIGQVMRSADWITAVSKAMLADTLQLLPEIAERSCVLYNGLRAPTLAPEPLPLDPPRILCIGRMVQEKGFDVAINAFASLVKRFPRARLVIAGDGPVRRALEEQSAALGLNESIEFTGWVSPEAVPALMNQCAVVVVPSRYREPFGLVAVEAAQMCRPVIAARVGGLAEAVADGQTGMLFENEDSAALAGAIQFLLDHPDAAHAMGQAGRARALSEFDFDRFIDDYDRLYKKLIRPDERVPSQNRLR